MYYLYDLTILHLNFAIDVLCLIVFKALDIIVYK